MRLWRLDAERGAPAAIAHGSVVLLQRCRWSRALPPTAGSGVTDAGLQWI